MWLQITHQVYGYLLIGSEYELRSYKKVIAVSLIFMLVVALHLLGKHAQLQLSDCSLLLHGIRVCLDPPK